MSHSAEPYEDEPLESTVEQPSSPPDVQPRRTWPRWVTLASALIAVIALGVAVWALLRPQSDTPPSPSAQQVADAKGQACAAYTTVRTAVGLQTQTDGNADPVAAQLVAANARLAMAVGSQHLVDNLSPAVPTELANSIRSLATDLQNLTISALAGTAGDDASQVARLSGLEANSTKIVELCK